MKQLLGWYAEHARIGWGEAVGTFGSHTCVDHLRSLWWYWCFVLIFHFYRTYKLNCNVTMESSITGRCVIYGHTIEDNIHKDITDYLPELKQWMVVILHHIFTILGKNNSKTLNSGSIVMENVSIDYTIWITIIHFYMLLLKFNYYII